MPPSNPDVGFLGEQKDVAYHPKKYCLTVFSTILNLNKKILTYKDLHTEISMTNVLAIFISCHLQTPHL